MGNTEIRRILFLKVPETRRPLLLSEIDRVAQVHDFHAAVSYIFFCISQILSVLSHWHYQVSEIQLGYLHFDIYKTFF